MAQGLLTNRGEKNQFAYYLGPETGTFHIHHYIIYLFSFLFINRLNNFRRR
jgi:hypothetical protein